MEEIKEGYTRVSSILGQWNHLAHIDKDVLANKCRIGSNVHSKISAEIEGIFVELQPDEEGYFESWTKWYKELPSSCGFERCEERFYDDELKITGCIDGIINYGDRLVIVDYKTSASVNKKMWPLQAAFYHFLVLRNGMGADPNVTFIHLKKDGKKAREVEVECTPHLWRVCLSALNAYRYFNA